VCGAASTLTPDVQTAATQFKSNAVGVAATSPVEQHN